MAVKLLHTADWQIGKVFRNIPGDEGAALRLQRFETVKTVAAAASEHAVDAIIVAGDIFDTDSVSDDTIRRTLTALEGFGGTWVLLPGNHDPALASSVWTRIEALGRPGNVILATEAQPVSLCDGQVAILPAVLRRRHESLDVTAWFDTAETAEDTFRVGLAHGGVEGASAQDSAAPNMIAADRARSARLDYLALGDWHSMREIDPRTWYAGTPEADRFSSPDPGHVLLVTLTEPGATPRVTPLKTGHYHWSRVTLDIAGEAAVDRIADMLGSITGHAADRQVVRLILSGVVSLSQRQAVDDAIAGWRARCHFLDTRTDDLIAAPSADDLDAIDHQGFVRRAVDRLKHQADATPTSSGAGSDEGDADGAAARRALQILWQEHAALTRGGQ